MPCAIRIFLYLTPFTVQTSEFTRVRFLWSTHLSATDNPSTAAVAFSFMRAQQRTAAGE